MRDAALLIAAMFAATLAAQVSEVPRSRPHSKQVDKLIKSLEIPSKKPAAVAELLRLGKRAAPDLGRAMADPRPEIIFCVAHILHMLGAEAKPALRDLERAAKREKTRLAEAARWAISAIRPTGVTLVSDYSKARVVELDAKGEIVMTIPDLAEVWSAQRLASGNILVCTVGDTVKEYDRKLKEVWSFKNKTKLRDAERLPNGRTLLSDAKGRIAEVDSKGRTVWVVQTKSMTAYDVDRLPSGRTLVTCFNQKRVYEIDAAGKEVRVVWKGRVRDGPLKSQRLANGHTLIALYTGGSVVEVDGSGKIVLRLPDLKSPNDATRLPDGSTLVGESGRIRVFDSKGREVWKVDVGRATSVSRY